MKHTLVMAALAAALSMGTAHGAVEIVNVQLSEVTDRFDNRVSALGGTVTEVPVVNGVGVYNYTDARGDPATLTVTRISGAALGSTYSYPPITEPLWLINPAANGSDTVPGEMSGLRFTFSSPVNAFGLEIGDWATCCWNDTTRPPAIQTTYGVPAEGSGLWIRFNGGTATMPANALARTDNPGYAANGQYANFIAAIDDSGTFSTIDFWGDGFGELLYAGGTMRFASVRTGAIGGTVAPVPSLNEIGVLALMLTMAGLGWARFRRR